MPASTADPYRELFLQQIEAVLEKENPPSRAGLAKLLALCDPKVTRKTLKRETLEDKQQLQKAYKILKYDRRRVLPLSITI